MAFGDPLDAWQWRYILGARTLTFGDGTALDVARIDGLDGYRANVGDLALPRGHGAVPGKHFLPPRDPVFDLEAVEATQADLDALRQQLADALVVSEDDVGTLEWVRPGQTQRFLRVRPVAVRWMTVERDGGQAASPRVGFTGADPRIYSTDRHTEQLTVFDENAGLDYDVDYAKEYTGSGGGDISVVNAGNADAWPLVRFHGPDSSSASEVQLVNRTTGVTVDVQTSIAAGQTLVVDLGLVVTRIASPGNVDGLEVHLGGASRYGDWAQTRTPLALAPGSNVLRFTAAGTTTGMRCDVLWYDTWL